MAYGPHQRYALCAMPHESASAYTFFANSRQENRRVSQLVMWQDAVAATVDDNRQDSRSLSSLFTCLACFSYDAGAHAVAFLFVCGAGVVGLALLLGHHLSLGILLHQHVHGRGILRVKLHGHLLLDFDIIIVRFFHREIHAMLLALVHCC